MDDGDRDMGQPKNPPTSGSSSHPSSTAMNEATRAVAPVPRSWTTEEFAFVLNYLDECLRHKESFKETAEHRLRDFSGRVTTYKLIWNRLYDILRKHDKKISVRQLLENGTTCLNLRAFPDDLLSVMKEQRSSWNLDELNTRDKDDSNDPAEMDSVETSTEPASYKRRLHSVPKSQRDRTVSDTDTSQDDPADTEYVDSTQEPDTATTKGSTKRVVIQSVERQPVPSPSREVGQSVAARGTASHTHTKGTAQKRKAPKGEVIVLDEPTPPPSKRPALDRTPTITAESPESSIRSKHPRIHDAIALLPQEPTSKALRLNIPAQPLQTFTTQNVSLAIQSQAPNKASQGELDDLSYLVCSLLQDHVESAKPLTPDMKLRLRNVQTSMQQEPGSLATRLLSNLNAADAANENLSNRFRAMVGSQQLGIDPSFPPVPNQQQVDREWQTVREGIREAFADERGLTTKGPEPKPMSTGYVASTIDSLLEDPRTRTAFFAQHAIHLESPHVAQSLISAVFCRWLFAIPDVMCEGKHSELTMKQYEATWLSDGLVEVQHIDKIGFSQLFADENFHKSDQERSVTKLVSRFSNAMKLAYPSAPGVNGLRDPKAWAEKALKLKQQLMISPRDYRIHFCLPGTLFDPTWMTAEDTKGFTCKAAELKGKDILTCVFPALVEQDSKAFGKNASISDALIKNKNFFPTWKEKKAFNPKSVISKAVVVVAVE